jgi:ATP-dependent RNA helicase SUPV3L1/SUV3
MPIHSPHFDRNITAVLGPTNTGKTHLAVERMMAHSDGVIGLPLRLLAREIFDRIVKAKGAANVALVTGEEKIVPSQASYFVCTVESMPLDRGFQFVAIDEIQLAADPERGHVFTDRLLYARGKQETMFLGAETIRGWIQKLIPTAQFTTRERFSRLTYTGPKKISRLPPRSAIVTFSTNDVYAIAELVRRHRGGAAVVMGSLSPRTRNAQVELYQSGDVDYLVATDAIGMGLNMDIDHVAFASTYKFDGVMSRGLYVNEMAQIAGRAGRHMNDGSFGVTASVPALDDELVAKIEDHHFDSIKQIRWRNNDLAFNTTRDLLRSLEKAPQTKGLISPREPDDHQTLKTLAQDEDIQKYSHNAGKVRQLWQVCQIPDFRKTMHDVHVRLLKQLFQNLQGPSGKLPTDWIAEHLLKLKKTDGDIDTLATRIAHTRTWTYISHVPEWVDDYKHWQEVARGIEDKLSDALHERLTQRFVDRRTSVLVRKLKDSSQLEAEINETGEVSVEGHFIGTLNGLRFTADMSANSSEARTLRNAGNKAIVQEIMSRAQQLAAAEDDALSLNETGEIVWRDMLVGRLSKGDSPLKPKVLLLASEQLNGAPQEAALKRANDWIASEITRRLGQLAKLADLPLVGAARGIAFQISENMGVLPRYVLNEQIRLLDKKDFGRLKFGGLRVGYEHVFMPLLLKPDPTLLRCLLWSIFDERAEIPAPPPAGRVSFEVTGNLPKAYWLTAGYALYKNLAVRLDMLDRLAGMLRRASRGLLETDEKPIPKAAAVETTPPAEIAETAPSTETAEASVATEAAETPAVAVEEVPTAEINLAAEDDTSSADTPDTPEAEKEAEKSEEKSTEKPKSKKDQPRNLPFKPTHEMLSLVGTTKDQFTLILENLGYEAKGEGEELLFQRASFKKRRGKKPEHTQDRNAKGKNNAPRSKGKGRPNNTHGRPKAKEKEMDPHSPFAILKTLNTK